MDVLDSLGEPAGWSAPKSEAHRRGLYHRCFHCWISAPADESGGPYLFVQRRSPEKETWPGRLDTTAAGHLSAGESALDGLRELEEELGLSPRPESLIPLGTRRVEQTIPAGVDRELHDVFLLFRNLTPGDVRLQAEEVGSLLRLRLGDVERLYRGGEIEAEEWPAAGGIRTTAISLPEFVPNDDRYLLTVARAAGAYLAGQEVGESFRVC